MDYVSQVNEVHRFSIQIPVRPYFYDHKFQDNAVFPAVEAMELLAVAVRNQYPEIDLCAISNARFEKFLVIPQDSDHLPAIISIQKNENGDIAAKLSSTVQGKKSSIKRTVDHVTLTFSATPPIIQIPPVEFLCALEGIAFAIPSETLYDEMVPFGVSYQNIRNSLLISETGAIADLRGTNEEPDSAVLGSPFIPDAAFHAACGWGQRYVGIIGFPVGFEYRVIFSPTKAQKNYTATVEPVKVDKIAFDVNIYICDDQGDCCEAMMGVRMRDVGQGVTVPPEWVRNRLDLKPVNLSRTTKDFSVIDLNTIKPFAFKCLSPEELNRFEKMGEKRKISYLGSRIACKFVSRRLSGNDRSIPSSSICTLDDDGKKPRCPVTGHNPVYCSVSHDHRFVICVTSNRPIGVDVERVSERVLNIRKYFLSEKEKAILDSSLLTQIDGAIYAWTIKEAIAKALKIDLSESWKRAELLELEKTLSRVQIDNTEYVIVHDRIYDHVFSVFSL